MARKAIRTVEKDRELASQHQIQKLTDDHDRDMVELVSSMQRMQAERERKLRDENEKLRQELAQRREREDELEARILASQSGMLWIL